MNIEGIKSLSHLRDLMEFKKKKSPSIMSWRKENIFFFSLLVYYSFKLHLNHLNRASPFSPLECEVKELKLKYTTAIPSTQDIHPTLMKWIDGGLNKLAQPKKGEMTRQSSYSGRRNSQSQKRLSKEESMVK